MFQGKQLQKSDIEEHGARIWRQKGRPRQQQVSLEFVEEGSVPNRGQDRRPPLQATSSPTVTFEFDTLGF